MTSEASESIYAHLREVYAETHIEVEQDGLREEDAIALWISLEPHTEGDTAEYSRLVESAKLIHREYVNAMRDYGNLLKEVTNHRIRNRYPQTIASRLKDLDSDVPLEEVATQLTAQFVTLSRRFRDAVDALCEDVGRRLEDT